MKWFISVSLMVLGVAGSITHGAEIFVPADYPTIQDAIDAASIYDTVIVAPGVYRGDGNRDIDFNGKPLVLRSQSGPELTIIDCNGSVSQNHRGFYFHNNETESAVVEGFTVRNGYTSDGGAVYCHQAHPLFSKCIFFNNEVSNRGGAVLLWTSNSRFMDCVFDNNQAASGAALHITSSSNPVLTWCEIKYGQATQGAGIICNGAGYTQVNNSLFFGNSSSSGSAMYIANGGTALVNGCTAADNNANYGTFHIYHGVLTINNSIVWGNVPVSIDVQGGPDPTVNYSNIEMDDGIYPGQGNMNQDPLFVNPLVQQYQLSHPMAGQSMQSPCFNSGSGDAMTICYDYYDGQLCMDTLTTRTDSISDSETVDLGFHYPVTEVPTATPTAQPTSGPTATPGPCDTTGVEIWMPAQLFAPGDLCSCHVTVCNAGAANLTGIPLMVILDVYGALYFAPGFNAFDTYLELYPVFAPGSTQVEVLPSFSWPTGAGVASGINFYGALTNPEMTAIVGDMDHWEFGWTE